MPDKSHADSLLRWIRKNSLSVLADWPTDQFAFQTTPHDNPAIWVMGHLAATDTWIGFVVGAPGTSTPESYQKIFGMGSKPTSDIASYPPIDEVRSNFNTCRMALLNWLDTADAKALAMPLTEKTGGFTSDPVDALYKLAWHEGWHMGQVATLRRALGLKSIFG